MVFEFDGFRLDTDRVELLRGGKEVPLEPKMFALLTLLIESQDRVVSKDEIIERVWEGLFVSDASVSTAIKELRKALGDDGRAQKYIKTVRSHGFRFVGEASQIQAAGPTHGQVPTATDAPQTPAPTPDRGKPVIAVLPFRLIGTNEAQAAIAEAIPSELIATLSRLRWIKVIARGSSFRFGDAEIDLDVLRARLGARYVLSGAVELRQSRLAVFVELTDTRDSAVVWSDQVDGRLDDVFETRTRIARDVVTALELRIPLHEADRLQLVPSENLDAWGCYHLGVRHMYRYNPTDNLIAETHFNQAIALDPSFARAHSGLSYTEFQKSFQQFGHDFDRHRTLAMKSAEQGVQLDPLDPFCNLILGRAKWLYREVEEGLHWINRSLAMNPNYAFGFYNSATLNTVLCEGDRAEADVAKSLQLSPLDPHMQSMYGTRALAELVRDDIDQASEFAERALRAPNAHLYVYMIAAAVHSHRGNLPRANWCVEQIRQKKATFGKADFLAQFDLRDSHKMKILKRALDRLGL